MQEKNERQALEQGQSMVEFAVGVMIVLTLLAGIIDFGRAYFAYIALRDAATEGAIYASVCPRHGNLVEQHVRDSSAQPVDLTSSDVSITCEYILDANGDGVINGLDLPFPACDGSTAPTPGLNLRVSVVYDNFPITMPMLGAILGKQTLTLRAEATESIMQDPNVPLNMPCPR
jgi:hypothetical protein